MTQGFIIMPNSKLKVFYTFAATVVLLSCSAPREVERQVASQSKTTETLAAASQDYTEPYRLQYHFSPEKNWMNDPNGMVYYDGEYHLFYQYNPFGAKWGHMSWGHAVSEDMLHWKHLPVALEEADNVMIFSGSAVVDWNNTSGFGRDSEPPLVAIYTGHHTDRKHQSQYIAYSNDKGRTWTKYENNPVLDIDKADFRDPKVFWHKPSEQWIMAVALPREFKIQLYGSTNLKDWNHLSDFGPHGAVSGIWECPDLFELDIENAGTGDKKKWMLYVSINPGHPAGGSGGQYFIGEFDGKEFVLDSKQDPEDILWVDHGADYYAAVSFSDIPEEDGRRILMGWASNWAYAQDIPTDPWRSSQGIPRSYSLINTDDGYRLQQELVSEFNSLRGEKVELAQKYISRGEFDLGELGMTGNAYELRLRMQKPSTGRVGLRLLKNSSSFTEVGYDADSDFYYIDRSKSGQTDFNEKFSGIHKSSGQDIPIFQSHYIDLQVLVDHSLVEAFFQKGRTTISDRVFPEDDALGVSLFTTDEDLEFIDVEFWPIAGVWN